MKKLLLIKHSKPLVNPDRPSDQWELGDEGRGRAAKLAEVLRPYALTEIVSSTEPKAKQTADVVAEALGLTCRTQDGLHEHDRRNVPHMDSREFISAIAQFFRQPRRLVLGSESADQAYKRFADAVDDIVQGSADGPGDIAIVTHGTVISLFAYRRAQEDPFALWRRMGLPSLIAFELPSYEVAGVVDQVT
jgi:broad specificity phosphatase PhoE